jgi:hypothetical protein
MSFDPNDDLKFYLLAIVMFTVFGTGVVTCSSLVRKINVSPSDKCYAFCGSFHETSVGHYADRFPVECICLDHLNQRHERIILP